MFRRGRFADSETQRHNHRDTQGAVMNESTTPKARGWHKPSPLVDWASVEDLTLLEAAYLAAGGVPCFLRDDACSQPPAASEYPYEALRILGRAVGARQLQVTQAAIRSPHSSHEAERIDPEDLLPGHVLAPEFVRFTAAEFKRWCLANDVPIPSPLIGKAAARREPLEPTPLTGEGVMPMPRELAIALQAWREVSKDFAKYGGVSPKTAITRWLADHHPEVSGHARERIATMANWQPGGGAPKTPVRSPAAKGDDAQA